jgi:hypothetical protein
MSAFGKTVLNFRQAAHQRRGAAERYHQAAGVVAKVIAQSGHCCATLRARGQRSSPSMRNHIKTLSISLAVFLILGCSAALADTKKPKPKPDETPKESVGLNYGTTVYTYSQSQRGNGSNVRKPITTSVNPALKGNVLQNSGVGSLKFSPEVTRSKSGAGKLP